MCCWLMHSCLDAAGQLQLLLLLLLLQLPWLQHRMLPPLCCFLCAAYLPLLRHAECPAILTSHAALLLHRAIMLCWRQRRTALWA